MLDFIGDVLTTIFSTFIIGLCENIIVFTGSLLVRTSIPKVLKTFRFQGFLLSFVGFVC